jgi:hypothetical protein
VSRLTAVIAFTCAAAFLPGYRGPAQAAESGCPSGKLCLYPQADYQGKPRILGMPKSPAQRERQLDDAACVRFAVASLIDNSGYGGEVYDNRQCDSGGKSQEFTPGTRIAKFEDWPVRSFMYPTD